jgi:hypothetical protein
VLIGTTSTIAAKMKASQGTDLILAAALRMMRGQNMESFSRDQLITEMRSATTYFKTTYISNLSKYIDTLVKSGKLMEVAKNTYALSAATMQELENQIGS